MNNIIIEKKKEDEEIGWMYLDILICSKFVTAKVICTSSLVEIEDNIENIKTYIKCNGKLERSLCFGLNIHPNLFINILSCEKTGHLNLEVNLDVDDSNLTSHKCCFFVNTEIGVLESFIIKLKTLVKGEIGTKVSLYDL